MPDRDEGKKIVQMRHLKEASKGYTDNIIGKITIPKINVELPIYLGATEANLEQGAAHLSQTSLPIGGINSNVVITTARV